MSNILSDGSASEKVGGRRGGNVGGAAVLSVQWLSREALVTQQAELFDKAVTVNRRLNLKQWQ